MLVKVSGRYDLVINPDAGNYGDNGADFFINAAQRYLDGRVNIPGREAIVEFPLVAGTAIVPTTLRAIHEVWLVSSTGAPRGLTETTTAALRERGAEYPFVGQAGTVNSYAIVSGKGSAFGTPSGATSRLSVLLFPPPNEGAALRIKGFSGEISLVGDAAASYWTEVYPDILVLATQMKLEEFYRNTEGAKDFQNAVDNAIMGIEKDDIETSVGQERQLNNSW